MSEQAIITLVNDATILTCVALVCWTVYMVYRRSAKVEPETTEEPRRIGFVTPAPVRTQPAPECEDE